MIFFCEDCGEKNLLSPSQYKGGKANFKCDACNYKNGYVFLSSKEIKTAKVKSKSNKQ